MPDPSQETVLANIFRLPNWQNNPVTISYVQLSLKHLKYEVDVTRTLDQKTRDALTSFQNAQREKHTDFNPKLGEIDQETVKFLTKELADQKIDPSKVLNDARNKASAFLSGPQNPPPSVLPELASNPDAVKKLQENLKSLQQKFGLRIGHIEVDKQTKEWRVIGELQITGQYDANTKASVKEVQRLIRNLKINPNLAVSGVWDEATQKAFEQLLKLQPNELKHLGEFKSDDLKSITFEVDQKQTNLDEVFRAKRVFTRQQLEQMLNDFNQVIQAENAKPENQKDTNLISNLTKVSEAFRKVLNDNPNIKKFRFINNPQNPSTSLLAVAC